MSAITGTSRSKEGERTQDTARDLQTLVEDVGLVLGLIALAALASPVSQLTLSPVFGAIPSSINHQAAICLTFVFGFLLHSFTRRKHTNKTSILSWLPLITALVPAAEYATLVLSEPLGVVGGASLAGLVSCHSIIISSTYVVASVTSSLPVGIQLPGVPPAVIKASLALLPFLLLERFFADQLPEIIAFSKLFYPADIQLSIAAAQVLLCGSGPAVVVSTWTLIIASYLLNPHGSGLYATSIAKNLLERQGWTLLARRWSITGYISVLESKKDDYRVLRCDHSLLGGEWLLNNERQSQGWTGNEPIYSIFSMLEAVRLLETAKPVKDSQAKALVIGSGIGTAPKALIQHGIDTTIIELDPAVYTYALEHFNLPKNHTAVLADAVTWTQQQASKDDFDRPSYDYIIHDVFTGGVEPLSLFTSSFLHDLRMLLSEHGVAAINYAGDLTTPLTKQVLNTIDLTFDRQCEVYSDDAARKDGSVEPFSNFIVFCRNSPGDVTFRPATTADFLGSVSRKNYLVPQAEQRIAKTWLNSAETLQAKDIKSWRRAQEQSAMKHWTIMRTVLPARVWEMY